MYPNYPYFSNVNPYQNQAYQLNQYVNPYCYNSIYQQIPIHEFRQQPIRGQATWTEGGQVTQCGIPWSDNKYMTVAVAQSSPYKCGQSLKITHMTSLGPREVIVTVVDQVRGYPPNKINLHKRAFEALGAKPAVGVINIEITPSPELEEEKWGKYLLELTQIAYPGFNVTDYKSVSKTEISPTQTKETFEFILENQQEKVIVQANVVYNPQTDRVISFDYKEVESF